MKIGFRKLSLKKKIKAMTTGKAKRKLKKIFVPGYGKKGIGLLKNPKRAIYNKVYNKATIGTNFFLKKQKTNKSNTTGETNLIVNIIIWLFIISAFIAVLPFYLIYLFLKNKKWKEAQQASFFKKPFDKMQIKRYNELRWKIWKIKNTEIKIKKSF